jgi:hypothetical protein
MKKILLPLANALGILGLRFMCEKVTPTYVTVQNFQSHVTLELTVRIIPIVLW